MSIDASDLESFNELISEIEVNCVNQLELIRNNAEQILRDAIQTKVYDYYTPNYFPRKNRLTNNVSSNIKITVDGATLYVYVDTNYAKFYSHYSNEDVSRAVPMWIDEGHYDMTGINNQFHSYEAREYLEEAFTNLVIEYGEENYDIVIDKNYYEY